MVHWQRRACVCCSLPTCTNYCCCNYGIYHSWGTILSGRVYSLYISLNICHLSSFLVSLDDVNFIHGRILGAILIIIGLYLVLWGKSEEKRLGLLQAKSSMVPENQPDNMDQSATLIINNSNGIKPNTSSSLTQPLLLDTSYKTINIPSPSDEPQP